MDRLYRNLLSRYLSLVGLFGSGELRQVVVDDVLMFRLAAEETKLVVTTSGPASAQVYRLSDLLAGNASLTPKWRVKC
jgi:hypothetical protein